MTFADVLSAAEVLKGVVHVTPVHTSQTLDSLAGAQVFLKCENFQRVGAFKFRGAYNALSRLLAAQKQSGVLTFSSGNHAQAIALAGKLLGIETTIVMPTNAPQVKRLATEGYGGNVILYDPDESSREELGNKLAAEHGLTIIPPYDHPHIIAGQGTSAKELFEEVGELDYLFVPCGGGGLLSGSSVSAKELSPDCRVIGVEPLAGNDGYLSFRSGVIETVKNPHTIADGARTPSLGKLTFELIRQNVHDIVTVDDTALLAATKFLWERTKLFVEPTGALGVAGMLAHKELVAGKRVGVVISGGNADAKAVAQLFE